MAGEVQLDTPGAHRRFAIKAVPSAATYLLMFDGYGKGDETPAGEKLEKGKSIVARIVSYGPVDHLVFDSDYKPPLEAQIGGYVCK